MTNETVTAQRDQLRNDYTAAASGLMDVAKRDYLAALNAGETVETARAALLRGYGDSDRAGAWLVTAHEIALFRVSRLALLAEWTGNPTDRIVTRQAAAEEYDAARALAHVLNASPLSTPLGVK
jgi:hypothetical protein